MDLGIATADIHDTQRHLRELHGIVAAPSNNSTDFHRASFNIVDPDGYRIQFVDAHRLD
ncbi:MAG: hypothetical protein ACI915_003996 [Gammaproteobacteria bacterium]|jgi:hypothetical protein